MAYDDEAEDPKRLPVPWTRGPDADLAHQVREWESGTRMHARLPSDFSWPSNPKEKQEEYGAGEVEQPISR